MSAAKRSPSAAAARLAGVMALCAGSAWYAELMRPLWTARALGPICGHAPTFAPHCPPCYAALALISFGLGLALAPARQPQLAVSRRR